MVQASACIRNVQAKARTTTYDNRVAEILLTTLNARFAHAAFGLRYLMANLGALRDRAAMLEFDGWWRI